MRGLARSAVRCALRYAAIWVGVLGLAQPADAQPRRGGPPSGPAERRDAEGGLTSPERREQIKKKIRTMRAFELTDELALDELTAGRLFPVLSRYDDETDKLLEKRIDVQRRLRHANALRDNRALDRLIDEAVATQRAFRDLEDRRLTDLRKILTPLQVAKLLVVLPNLERRIQKQLRNAIVQRRAGKNAPAEDVDDDQEPDEIGTRPGSKNRPDRIDRIDRREAPLAPRGAPSNAPGNVPPCDPNTQPCR
jgi:hypothetical protein